MLILILANNLINANSINTYLTVCIKHKMVLLSIYSFSQQNHLKKKHTHTHCDENLCTQCQNDEHYWRGSTRDANAMGWGPKI